VECWQLDKDLEETGTGYDINTALTWTESYAPSTLLQNFSTRPI